MSTRPRQARTMHRYRANWIGQWLEEALEQEGPVHKSVTLESVSNMTNCEARGMLRDHITKLGVNMNEYLECSLTPVITFGHAADRYETGRLQNLKPSTHRTKEYHLKKSLRPYFEEMLISEIPAEVLSDAVRSWARSEESRNTLLDVLSDLSCLAEKPSEKYSSSYHKSKSKMTKPSASRQSKCPRLSLPRLARRCGVDPTGKIHKNWKLCFLVPGANCLS